MISSLCPRPIGNIASIERIPVSIGTLTDFLSMIPAPPARSDDNRRLLYFLFRQSPHQGRWQLFLHKRLQPERLLSFLYGLPLCLHGFLCRFRKNTADLVSSDILYHSLKAVFKSNDFPVHRMIYSINRSDPSPTVMTVPTSLSLLIISKSQSLLLRSKWFHLSWSNSPRSIRVNLVLICPDGLSCSCHTHRFLPAE